MGGYTKKQPKASAFSVRNSYKELLKYYYEAGVGTKSEITGIIITEKLISTIERRYKQLGGIPPINIRNKDNDISN